MGWKGAGAGAFSLAVFLLLSSPPGAGGATLYVRAREAVLKADISAGAPVSARLKAGEALEVIDRKDPWFQVRTGAGKTGWIHRVSVTTEPPGNTEAFLGMLTSGERLSALEEAQTGASVRGLEEMFRRQVGTSVTHLRSLAVRPPPALPPPESWWRGVERRPRALSAPGKTSVGKDGARMVLIPRGDLIMGREGGPREEGPRRKVFVEDFYIDIHEVTYGQYQRFLQATGGRPPYADDLSAIPHSWQDGRPPPGLENHPVTLVSWAEAEAYCRWAGKRLPTEAEWEKAARGADGRLFPWGSQVRLGTANTADRWAGKLIPATAELERWWRAEGWAIAAVYPLTAPVGSFPAGRSAYGAVDLLGNVREWVEDWFSPDYYHQKDAPTVNPRGPQTGTLRAVRGTSWRDLLSSPLTVRRGLPPGARDVEVGFRCARSLDPFGG